MSDRIPTEQTKTYTGVGPHTMPVNGDFLYLQATIYGRNDGEVVATIRPIMEKNSPADFIADDFEGIEDGTINLATSPKKRTFTVDMKRPSALRFAFNGAGSFKVHVRQWGRAGN